MGAVVSDPGLTEHLFSEAARPGFAVPTEFGIGAVRAATVAEGVSAGAQPDERLAGQIRVHEVLHLVIGPMAEPQSHHHHVRRIQCLSPRQASRHFRIDGPVGRVYGEKHRAFEPMPFGENFRQLRQCFLRAVLLVASEQNDVLARTGAGLAFINDKVARDAVQRCAKTDRCRQKEEHSHVSSRHGRDSDK